MNIRDLKYITAVDRLKSFRKAADACFVSQPTLSMQIKKLEATLGVKIFERNNKQVLVTELGQQIISSAHLVLKEVNHIEMLARDAQNPLAGNFKLGAFPTLAPYVLPKIIPNIKKQLPDTRLILVEEKTASLMEQLIGGELDAALIAWPVNEPKLMSEVVFEDEFKLAVSSNHTLAKKNLVSYKDLVDQPLLLLDEGHCLRDQALQLCQLEGLNEMQDVRASSLETLRQMVRANTGITLMPTIAIQDHTADIQYIPFSPPRPSRRICLVWRKSSPRLPVVTILKGIISSLFKV